MHWRICLQIPGDPAREAPSEDSDLPLRFFSAAAAAARQMSSARCAVRAPRHVPMQVKIQRPLRMQMWT